MATACRFRRFSVRARVASVLIAVCLLSQLIGAATAADSPFYLFKDGQPMAAIVLPEGALDDPGERMSPVEPFRVVPADVPSDLARAIAEFRRDLLVGYGIDLPVVFEPADRFLTPDPRHPTLDTHPLNRIEIVVEDRPLIDEDRTAITFPSASIMRITGGESGVRRALFRLLEDFGGVRYLFQGAMTDVGFGAHFPSRDTLGIPRESLEWTSAFPLYRGFPQTTYGSNWPDTRNRAYFWNWEMRLGAKARTAAGHMRVPFPLEQYAAAAEKPDEDIFPLLRGERYLAWLPQHQTYYHWQPRYSSPAAVDEAVRNIKTYLRAHPGVTSVALGVNDSGGHCDTERGREVETYYRWVNAVAERVAAEFPGVVLTVLAYREVEPAPPFKLHPNVLSILCFDLHACLDPEVRARREQLIRDWSAVARIGHYGYDNGDYVFALPRIYFTIHQEMIRFLHEHGAEHGYAERGYSSAPEGPKTYLFLRMLENPELDREAVLLDWCEAAVGVEAALPLREYYSFWEDFWETKAIHTSWWRSSKNSIYLSYTRFGSYMYALEPGDMAHCRDLMERVVELADAHGTPEQRERAAFLMATFEWYEANARAIGAEHIAPDGKLPDRDAALALLRDLPAAQAAAEKAFRLPYETRGWLAPGIVTGGPSHLPEDTTGSNANVVAASLALAADYVTDEAVQAELQSLAQNDALIPRIRFLADTLLRTAEGDDAGNLAVDGTFATDAHGWSLQHPVHGRVQRSDTVAFRGTHSLKCEIEHWNFMTKGRILEAEPGKAYFFSARVFIPKDQAVAEGRLNIRGSVTYRDGDGQFINRNHTANIPDIALTPGQWNYVSCIIPAARLHPQRGVDSLALRLHFKSFEIGDVAYIDDIQVYPIADTDQE